MKIAVLYDDSSQTGLSCQVLASVGHVCHSYQSGKEILEQLRRESYDMLILDWLGPDFSGIEVLLWIREKFPKILPVLFITSRASEDDIVAALAAGADDYIIKPIRHGELIARVQALLRRAYPIQNLSNKLAFGDYLFETRAGRLILAGKFIEITQKEFELALLFFRNLDHALSRTYILETVWSRGIAISSRTIDTHVSRLRTKLQLRPENGYRLATVYCYGYRLEKINPIGISEENS
ncbi:DNA-binding response OmpR family regulator [Collimonas sp. PA-H2]|uniref:response regulator transcription factor n=1 Tax=Collimonas sp. PA-H2 TaxID=1881062 RepID=UPI000BFA16CD|nr:response regulator transcription factor [Collimonas sp. PA-H2]PFH08075.1 DNA-binding response OmpR family regulator [Collimonas sp. PA-H2]